MTYRRYESTRFKHRLTHATRTYQGGCYDCSGSLVIWDGANVKSLAARHHDKTKHRTWARCKELLQYGAKVEGSGSVKIDG